MASMATRECLSSAARNQARVLSEPRVASPRGSKPLNGIVAPGMSIRLALKAVDPLFTFWAGANALAAPARAIRVAATFILMILNMLLIRQSAIGKMVEEVAEVKQQEEQ